MRNSIFSDFISLLFPRYCFSCKEQLYAGEECICLICKHSLPKTNYHSEAQNPVMIKLYGKAPIAFASSYLRFVKSGKTQRLLHQLKYHNQPEIGKVLGNWYGKDLDDTIQKHKIELIVPVPLHKKKLKRRGYNQSDGFAIGISEALNVEVNCTALKRVKESETQTKKSKLERWENVEDVFLVQNVDVIINKHIMVVDDVITTGSTLASCAIELLSKGAASVSIVTIAVAEYS
jgi:ComF family protein